MTPRGAGSHGHARSSVRAQGLHSKICQHVLWSNDIEGARTRSRIVPFRGCRPHTATRWMPSACVAGLQ